MPFSYPSIQATNMLASLPTTPAHTLPFTSEQESKLSAAAALQKVETE
jgi:hypothetical protein